MSGGAMTLRPLHAGRLLEIRREVRARTEDALERAALCNAQVLAESCRDENGNPVYSAAEAVLDELTFPEMERLLAALSGGAAGNPNFDQARFDALREG